MIFDKKTLLDWKTREITDISVTFIEKGCAGQKISISEERNQDFASSMITDGIHFWMPSEYQHTFQGSRITQAGGKWIFTSDVVNTRCGCGSSFSLKSKSPLQDKIARTKLAIKQKKEGIHN